MPEGTLPDNLQFYNQFLTGLRGHGVAEHKIALNDKWEVVSWDDPSAWLKAVLDYKIHLPDQMKVVCYDWKTGKIYDDHNDQKNLYSITQLAEHPDAVEVEFFHVYLDLNRSIPKTLRREWAEASKGKWKMRVDVMEGDTKHIANPTYMCRFCPYRRENGGPCRF